MPAVADWSGIAVATVGGLLGTTTAAATWKTAESPYMGRVTPRVECIALFSWWRGPTSLTEELRPPERTRLAPSAREVLPVKLSVPSWLQPVMG